MSTPHLATDSQAFRLALGRFPTGVTIVTTQLPGQAPMGLTVSSFNSVSLNPPLVVWSLSKQSSSRLAFQNCERYVIHVLAADQMSLANRFAKGTQAERFEGIGLASTPHGAIRLDLPCAAWFECVNKHVHEEGDHLVFISSVEHCADTETLPLIYHAGGYDLTPKGT
jgi:flavin reductase (DIM6/NTAB) family NADH-FMN oxidoreductase RutF